jgi:hypothetical protein
MIHTIWNPVSAWDLNDTSRNVAECDYIQSDNKSLVNILLVSAKFALDEVLPLGLY